MQAVIASLKKMLPVLDNFERASSVLKPATDAERKIMAQFDAVQVCGNGGRRCGRHAGWVGRHAAWCGRHAAWWQTIKDNLQGQCVKHKRGSHREDAQL
eukprot:130326-Chlamydomonas_euryale.AAC.3